MQSPLRITLRELAPSRQLAKSIRDRAMKIEQRFPQVMSWHIFVDVPKGLHSKKYNVRIDVRMPEEDIVISRDHEEDLLAAVRQAFDHTRRRLETYRREHLTAMFRASVGKLEPRAKSAN